MSAPARILITGAGKRLGAVMARHLAAPDRVIVIHYHTSRDEAAALATALSDGGMPAVTVAGDLTDDEAVRTLTPRAAEAAGGPLTCLINNASVFEPDSADAMKRDVYDTAMRVNAQVPMELAAAFVAAADAGTDNLVVNLLDQKLWNLNPDFYSYTASKAALLAATYMMDGQFGAAARAIGIAPGILFPSYDQTQAEYAAAANRNLLGRPIAADDVARAVAFALDTPSFRGQILHVDNGQRFMASRRDVMFGVRG